MSISPTIRKRLLVIYIGLFVANFSLLTAALVMVKVSLGVSGAMLLAMHLIGFGAITLADRELRKAAPRMFCKRKDRTPAENLWLTSYFRRVINDKPTAINFFLVVASLLTYLGVHCYLQNGAPVSLLASAGIFLLGLFLGTICGYAGTQIRIAVAEDFLATTQHNEVLPDSLRLPTH